MKFTANSAKSYQDSSSSIPFSKKILNFERITPFELKPESLAETQKDEFYRHICEIKATYSTFKHYFIQHKLYKPTELIDKFWQVTWFGYHLPLEELTNYLVEKYKSHPSNLQEILVQHRGVENGKSLTSLLLIFDKYFWLTSDSEFTIAVAEKKITGLAKPGWNLEKSREMFAVCHDDNKYHWPANKKMENQSEEEAADDDKQEALQDLRPKKKQKLLSKAELEQVLEEKVPSKEWITSLFSDQLQQVMSLKKSLMDVEARMTKRFSELQALIADKLSNEKEQDKGKDKDKDKDQTKKRNTQAKPKGEAAQTRPDFLVKDQNKSDPRLNTPKLEEDHQ